MGRRATKHRAVPAKKAAPVTPLEVEKRFGPDEAASLLSRMLGQELEALTTARKKLTATQRQTQIRRCVATLAELGELTGESGRMTEAKLVRHPAFRRAIAEMVKTLEPWPEAMRAVGETLSRIESGQEPQGVVGT